VNSSLISYNGRVYAFNVNAIMEWCLSSKDNLTKETEITEGYDMNDSNNVGSKVIRELQSPNTQDDTIRYDFLKMILGPFIGGVNSFIDIQNNLSLSLLFNTLIDMGFLIEIKD
jgi:hypothetical protein